MDTGYFQKFSDLINQQKFEKAETYVQELLDKQPTNPDFLGLRGVAKFYLKDITCIDDLTEAVELDSKNAYRYSSRAYILDALGDTSAAIQDYLKAVELDPEDHIAFNNLGMLEEKLGRKQEAGKHFDASDKLLGLEKKGGKHQFPQENLQSQLDQNKKSSKLDVIRDMVFSKKGWNEFYLFLKTKFNHAEKA